MAKSLHEIGENFAHEAHDNRLGFLKKAAYAAGAFAVLVVADPVIRNIAIHWKHNSLIPPKQDENQQVADVTESQELPKHEPGLE